MKIRKGFVSNSSSTSFVCKVCGRQETGFDASLSDFEMCECINGHTFCLDELVENVPDNAKDDEYPYQIAELYCPICQWHVISESDFSRYLLQEYKIPREEAFEDVKKLNKRRKKLYNGEYVMYVCNKLSLNKDDMLQSLKTKFVTYKEYMKYLR